MITDPYSALVALGDTKDAVAKTLHIKEVRGYRNDTHDCPVSNYLLDVCGASRVKTGLTTVVVHWSSGSYEEVTLPNPVTKFLIDFDSGEYPELEEKDNEKATRNELIKDALARIAHEVESISQQLEEDCG